MRAASAALALMLLAWPAAAAVGPLEPLPAQTLSTGGCALFVWARSEPRGPVLMATDARARVSVGGRIRDLVRDGAPRDGRQTFQGAGLTLALDLALEEGRVLSGGTVIPDGVLTVTDGRGVETVSAVAAVAACRD